MKSTNGRSELLVSDYSTAKNKFASFIILRFLCVELKIYNKIENMMIAACTEHLHFTRTLLLRLNLIHVVQSLDKLFDELMSSVAGEVTFSLGCDKR